MCEASEPSLLGYRLEPVRRSSNYRETNTVTSRQITGDKSWPALYCLEVSLTVLECHKYYHSDLMMPSHICHTRRRASCAASPAPSQPSRQASGRTAMSHSVAPVGDHNILQSQSLTPSFILQVVIEYHVKLLV